MLGTAKTDVTKKRSNLELETENRALIADNLRLRN